jgi:2,4-dichlorophenol 6-monooxygenase
MAARKEATPEAEKQRQALREAIEYKNYEFNTLGVELNQRYASSAVVADGTPDPGFARDAELYHQATTCPGAKLPHAWLGRDGHRVSTLDLGGHGHFTLFTGIGGDAWASAALRVGAALGVEITPVVVGPGREYEDPYDDWARLRETADAGCVLTRPDNHVCYRHHDLADDPSGALEEALRQVLGR